MPHDRSKTSLPLVLQAPSVLVLTTTMPELLTRMCDVLEPRGFLAAETTLTTVREDVAQYRPKVLFIDGVLYDFDARAFDAMAQETGTKLAIIYHEKDATSLLQRLLNPANSSGLYDAATPDASTALLEADTAEYDKDTVHKQVELMRQLGEADTLKLDRTAIHRSLEAFRQSPEFETMKYERSQLREQLELVRATEESENSPGADQDTES